MPRSKQKFHVITHDEDNVRLDVETFDSEQKALDKAASLLTLEPGKPKALIVQGRIVEWKVGAVRIPAPVTAEKAPRKSRAKKPAAASANGAAAVEA